MAKGDYTDKELYDYTVTIMKNIVHYYLTTDFDEDTDINKLIERNIARKVANVMPDRYVEAEVSVLDIGTKKGVATSFSTDAGVKLIAMYDEVPGAMISHGEMTKKIIERPVALGVSSRGHSPREFKNTVMKASKKSHDGTYSTKEYPQYDENGHYDPRCRTEVFDDFTNRDVGRGSKVETLPVGKGIDELSDLEYFKKKVYDGLKLPRPPKFDAIKPPTSWSYMVNKTSPVVEDVKPTIDFTQISQISIPTHEGLPRYESGVHVGIDTAKFNVVSEEEKAISLMAKSMADVIDKQILEDITKIATGAAETEIEWAVPTNGWTPERTDFDSISWSVGYRGIPSIINPFGGVITDEIAPDWRGMNKPTAMEEISFTEEELDELIDLINVCESQVMKFV